jgi:hypothetical protein
MATVGRCGAQGTSPSHKKAAGMLKSPSQRHTLLLPEAVKDTKSAKKNDNDKATYRTCQTPPHDIHPGAHKMMEQGYH